MQQEKGLLCQMDKNEARVLGEDEQAGCHIREDLESPEGSLDFVHLLSSILDLHHILSERSPSAPAPRGREVRAALLVWRLGLRSHASQNICPVATFPGHCPTFIERGFLGGSSDKEPAS